MVKHFSKIHMMVRICKFIPDWMSPGQTRSLLPFDALRLETCSPARYYHGNPAVTALKPSVMGSHFYRGSGGNGDSYLETHIDYHGKTAVTSVMVTISVVLPRLRR